MQHVEHVLLVDKLIDVGQAVVLRSVERLIEAQITGIAQDLALQDGARLGFALGIVGQLSQVIIDGSHLLTHLYRERNDAGGQLGHHQVQDGAALLVTVGHIGLAGHAGRNRLAAIAGQGTLVGQVAGQVDERAAHRGDHAADGLVQIDLARLGGVQATPAEVVHHIVIHDVGRYADVTLLGIGHERCYLIGQTRQPQIGVQTQVITVGHRHGKVARTVPTLGDAAGNDVKRHQLAGGHTSAHALQVEVDRRLDLLALLLPDDSGLDGLIGIDGNKHLGIADLVDAVGVVLALGTIDGLQRLQRRRGRIVGLDKVAELALVVGIRLLASLHGQRCRLISGALHLADVPVGGQITQVDGAHIGAVALYLLQIPQREGVVVTVAEDDTVLGHTRQIVAAKVASGIAAAAIVVVPRLAHHLQGNDQTYQGGYTRNSGGHTAAVAIVASQGSLALGLLLVLLQGPHHEAPQSGNAHTHPDAVGIERTRIGVVTLTGLARRLVQVEHDSDTGHEEQEEDHPELLDATTATVGLPQQADDTHDERQHVEHIVALVALAQVVGQQALVTQARIVDKGVTRDPVAMGDFAHTLQVVLATGKVPHKVAPVHIVQLVVDKEAQVLHHGGLHLHLLARGIAVGVELGRCLDLGALHTEPLDILALMLIVVDAREQHILLGAVTESLLLAQFLVAVGLVARGLHLGGILHRAFLDGGLHRAIARLLIHDVAIERAAIQQRRLTILLTAQILGQGIGVIGRVLVQGRVLRTADENHRVATEADKNHQHAGNDVGKHAHRHALTELEQIDAQGNEKHQGDEHALTQEQHTRQQNHQGKRQLDAHRALVAVQFPQRPADQGQQHNGIGQHTRVERHAKRVDKHQVKLLSPLHKARLQTIQDQAHDDKRHEQRQA